MDTHEPGCVGGSGARRWEAAERAASRSTSPGGIALPGGLPAFALVAVKRRRLLLQALPGFPVAARVDSLPGVAGVALARLTDTERELIIGRVDWTSKLADFPNVARTPLVGGQWRRGTRWPFELAIVSNAANPEILVTEAGGYKLVP